MKKLLFGFLIIFSAFLIYSSTSSNVFAASPGDKSTSGITCPKTGGGTYFCPTWICLSTPKYDYLSGGVSCKQDATHPIVTTSGCYYGYRHQNSTSCGYVAPTATPKPTATPVPTPTPTPKPTPYKCGTQYYDITSCGNRYCCINNINFQCNSTQCATATPVPTPATYYGIDNYNTYTHFHPIPANSGDTCTTQGAKYMCSSIAAITANGETAVTNASCSPYTSGSQATINGTKYTLGMSYSNYCITVADNLVPSPISGSVPAPNPIQPAAGVTSPPAAGVRCVNLPGTKTTANPTGIYPTAFTDYKWSAVTSAQKYHLKYWRTDNPSTVYGISGGPYITTNNTTTYMSSPFSQATVPNSTGYNCNGTGFGCGFLNGEINWQIASIDSAGKETWSPIQKYTIACNTQNACTDPQVTPHFVCDTTNQTCVQSTDLTCAVNDCSGTNDVTTCRTTTPNCDATPKDCNACTGNANTCGTGSQNCTLTTYQGSTNCVNVTAPQQCTYDRCSDTVGNVCQNGLCVNPINPSPTTTATAQPTDSANPSPTNSGSPQPTAPPVTCNAPNLNPHFECQQNTCVAVNTCAQNSGGCTRAGDNCGVPAGNTSLSFVIGLDAIGNTGDTPNPYDTYSSNQNPLRPIRNLKVEVYDSSYNLVLTKTGIIAYEYDSGMFSGTIDIGKTLSSGKYIVKVVSDGYLRRLIPGAQNIVAGQENFMPEVNLIVGDITQGNELNILDYNILMSCSVFSADNGGACKQAAGYKTLSDLEDNGVINQFDYNLFVREYSVQNGQ